MNVEVERKFVLPSLPPQVPVMACAKDRLHQAHLPLAGGDLRVRRTHSGASLGVKGPGDLARAEWEADIPDWVFELLERNGHGSICKVRYTLRESERELVIDHFEGNLAGLVMLECEFESEESAASFELPSWAAGAVEVTYDPRFKNAALALVSDVRELCASVMPAPPVQPTSDLFGELERGRIVIDA